MRRRCRMRFTKRDLTATLLVAAIVIPYVGYVTRGSMPFIKDPRGMATTGLILGLIAMAVVGRSLLASRAARMVVPVLSLMSLGLGVAALWAETDEALLSGFVVSIVVVWAIAMLSRSGALDGPHAHAGT
jgi:hypothetical protein